MAKCYEGEIAESHVFLAMRVDSHAQHGMEVLRGQGLKFWKVLPHEKTWARKYYLTLSYIQRDGFQIIEMKSDWEWQFFMVQEHKS